MWMGGVDKQAVVCDPDLALSPLTHPPHLAHLTYFARIICLRILRQENIRATIVRIHTLQRQSQNT